MIAGSVLAALAGCGGQGGASNSHAKHSGTTDSRATLSQAPPADTAQTGHAHLGDLTITGGYIPQPASPDVAAAYLTVGNAGAVADTITKVVSNVTASVMAMNETDHGGVGTMTDVGTLTVPAHGRISLTPGHAHLMLENPRGRLRAGQHVTVTVTFAHAGALTLVLPVVPLTGAEPMPSMSMSRSG